MGRSIRQTRRRSTESAPKACTSPTATPCFPRRRCPTRRRLRRAAQPRRYGTVRQSALHRLSAVHVGDARPATRHRCAGRRRSVCARRPQPAVRRQLPPRGLAARICAVVRLQHRGTGKNRARGCAGSVRNDGRPREDARSPHHHSRRGDRLWAFRAAQRGHARAADGDRTAAGAAAAHAIGGDAHRAGHARRECRSSAVVCRRGDEGHIAGVCEERRTIRARVLVGRSRLHAACAGRQPERALARHQRRDVDSGHSERRPKSEADPGLPGCEPRGTRQHERLRHLRPWVLDGQPARRRYIGARNPQLCREPAIHGRRRAAGGERRIPSAWISGD